MVENIDNDKVNDIGDNKLMEESKSVESESKIVKQLKSEVELIDNDTVLDIASNDGTLLKSYDNQNINLIIFFKHSVTSD